MQTISVETLILGASYAALGYAAAHPGTLIVEETEGTGVEYAGNMRPSDLVDLPVTELGKQFYAFLKEHELVTEEGRLDLCGMTTAVNRYAVAHKLWILLDAAVVSVKKSDNGYVVECRTNSGLREIQARILLDTTSRRISSRGAAAVTRQWLHVLCSEAMEDPYHQLKEVNGDIITTPGFWPGEWTVSFPFSGETKLPEARLAVERQWRAAFPGGETLIDAVGFDFDVEAVDSGDEGICAWVGPHRYGNPVAAFDGGAALSVNDREGVPGHDVL